MGKQVDIIAYRPVNETVTLRSWLMIDTLTHFDAKAHILDGVPYVEIDFAYDGPQWCIKVYAYETLDLEYLVLNDATGEWDHAAPESVVHEGSGLTLNDLTPLARTFCEMHFWNDEP